MPIRLTRAYHDPHPEDGTRILVERLWPRGVAKADAKIDLWLKDLGPSTELRKWFDHVPSRWAEFKRRYFAELKEKDELLNQVRECQKRGPVTFVFASKEERYNNAVALKEFLER